MTSIIDIAGLEPDQDLRKLHLHLASDAQIGNLVGSIVISIYGKGRAKKKYYLHLAGWPVGNVTMATGVMSSCQFLLQERALQDAGLI